ncbi:MAG: acyltransferase family protein [Cyanobacteriota bacterium]|nr:acyltransferase family protein [Cyanobacteriota bacterium]
MNQNSQNQKNRNAWLDTLRGLSAIWVVLYHFNGRIPEQDNLYYQFTRLGYIGVPIFFIISGFCIQLAAKSSKSMSDFFWRRFSRIYPPYADPSSISIQIASVFTVLSIIFSFKYNSFLNANNILCYVGELSYSLYLLHVPIGCYLLIRYRQGIWLESLPLHILYDFSLLLICLGFSFLFYKYVEKPAIALGKTGLNFKLNSKKI